MTCFAYFLLAPAAREAALVHQVIFQGCTEVSLLLGDLTALWTLCFHQALIPNQTSDTRNPKLETGHVPRAAG
jgi:hypothetical protein